MTPSQHEHDRGILMDFRDSGWIQDVLELVNCGKEARVYCCRGTKKCAAKFVAAKIYMPQAHRTFRKDHAYHEGRTIVDDRLRRAFHKKSRTGKAVQFSNWVQNEWDSLRLLHAKGCAVPLPIAVGPGALLMEFVGNGSSPAPQLRDVALSFVEADRLFGIICEEIKQWLALDRIHSDLSAYNILYHSGVLRIIDFPQVVDARFNPNALDLLHRDLSSICRHFRRYGIQADDSSLANTMWRAYIRNERLAGGAVP